MAGNQFSNRTQAEAIPLRARFKAALALRGETVASWARSQGFSESLVWMNLSGARLNDDVRVAIAGVLEMQRDDLDAQIAEAA